MSVIACIWNASCEFVSQISAPLHRVLARVTRVRARARTHCSAQICRLTEPESLLEFASRLVEPTGIRHEPTALLALARAAVIDAIPGVPVSMVTGDRELSSTRTVANHERGRPARNSEPTGNTVNSNTEPV